MSKNILTGTLIFTLLLVGVEGLVSCKDEKQGDDKARVEGKCMGCSDCKSRSEWYSSMNDDGEELIMTYEFDMKKGEGLLVRKNLNLSNCDAEPYSKVDVDDNTITIENIFTMESGLCDCYFDISTKITGVQENKYHIVIIEGYNTHEFDIDLSKKTSGKYYY